MSIVELAQLMPHLSGLPVGGVVSHAKQGRDPGSGRDRAGAMFGVRRAGAPGA
jgi:hypothetical protein